jgi:hypothetical protein
MCPFIYLFFVRIRKLGESTFVDGVLEDQCRIVLHLPPIYLNANPTQQFYLRRRNVYDLILQKSSPDGNIAGCHGVNM